MEKNDKITNKFVVFVDRIEGNYAVCELPDETMCDVKKDLFPADLKERERYEVEVQATGDFKVIKKRSADIASCPLPSKLIRF